MKSLILSIIISLSFIGFVRSAVQCSDTEYCPDKYKCCQQHGYYTCCPNGYYCDGEYCTPYLNTKFSTLGESMKKTPSIRSISNKYVIMTDSFLETVGVYKFLPQTTKMGKMIGELAPLIYPYILKLKEATTQQEIMSVLIEVYVELKPQLEELADDFKEALKELSGKLMQVYQVLTEEGYFDSLVENVKQRFSEVISNITSAKTMYENGDYKQAGEKAGLAIAIIFKID